MSAVRHGAVGWSNKQIAWDIIDPRLSAKPVPISGVNQLHKLPTLWTQAQKPKLNTGLCWQVIGSLKVNGRLVAGDGSGMIQEECHTKDIKQLDLQVAFRPAYGDEKTWQNLAQVVMGVPLLIKDGQVLLSGDEKSIFYQAPFARTVIGETREGHIVFIVVESNLLGDFWLRQTGSWNEMFYPRGMSLYTLSRWLVDHGVVNALNLDGGGSSGLAFKSKILVRPKLDFNGMFEPLERKLSHSLVYDLAVK